MQERRTAELDMTLKAPAMGLSACRDSIKLSVLQLI